MSILQQRPTMQQAVPFDNNNTTKRSTGSIASRPSIIEPTRLGSISGYTKNSTRVIVGDNIIKELKVKQEKSNNTSLLYNIGLSTATRNYLEKRKDRQPRIISQKEELLKRLHNLGLTFSSQLSDKDEVLRVQFINFHKEFLDVATSLGATVPLDLHENNMSGLLFNFLKHRGPKYVLQIMSQKYEVESQGAHLQVLSLSLLITVVTILAKKMDDTANLNGWTQLMAENVSTWSRSSLNKIVFSGAINTLVHMLMTTHVQKIQVLILGLLAQLAEVSKEACHLMLMPFSSEMHVKKESKSSRGISRTESRGESGKNSSSRIGRARSSSSLGSPTNRAVSPNMDDDRTVDSYSSVKSRETFEGDLKAEVDLDISSYKGCPGTNLSYLLTIAIMNRNKYAIVSGIIDVIISLCITNTANVCEAVAMTPTCNISANSDDKAKGSSKHTNSKSNNDKGDPLKSSSTQTNTIEWAGLKLLIKTGTIIIITLIIIIVTCIIISNEMDNIFVSKREPV